MNVLSLGAAAGLDPLKGALGTDSNAGGRTQFELRAGTFVQNELSVVSVHGREALSTPYEYDVQFTADIPTQLLQLGVFGFPACLSIMTPTEPRVIQGLAVGFECVGAAEAELSTATRRYSMKLVPRLWLLNHNRRYRVFQDKSAVELAIAILDSTGIAHTVNLERREYPSIPFMYQRGETDLEFLHRILATAGIFYYFEHASGLLEELLPGAGAATALLGGLGGMASGAASLAGSVGSLTVGLGGAAGGAVGALGAVAGAATTVAAAVGAITTLVLCDRAHHAHAFHGSSLSAAADAAVGAGLGALGGAIGSAAGSLGGTATGLVTGFLGGGLGEALVYDGNGQASSESERVFSFRLRKEVRPKRVTVQDWNLQASAFVEQNSDSAAAHLDIAAGLTAMVGASGLGAAVAANVDVSVDALHIATKDVAIAEYQRDASLLTAKPAFSDRALAQARADWIVGRGETDSRRLAAGYRFTLAGHPIAAVNSEYLVTEITCAGYAPDQLPSDSTPLYASTFSSVPTSVDPLPSKPALPAFGSETAVVVGPVDGDVFCDERGRILVRFRWAKPSKDFSATAEGVCWVHWLERWAGDGYGTMTLPRVGSEVLVEFLRQEGGRPIAVGQFYSKANMPPFDLPGHASIVGIRSRTIGPSGGHSELSIDDQSGAEKVHLRSQRDMSIDVVGNECAVVGGDRVLDVSGGHFERVRGDSSVEVDGCLEANVGGEYRSTIGGSVSQCVRGAAAAQIAGPLVLETGAMSHRIGDSLDLSVSGDCRIAIQHSRQTAVALDDIATVGARRIVTVGGGTDDAESDVYVWGNYRVGAKKAIVLEAEECLVLRCGTTELRLTRTSLELLAESIRAAATTELELRGKGPSLTFGSEAQILGNNISLHSSGASLELGATATISGAKVEIGSGAGKPIAPAQTGINPNKKLALTITDALGTPLAERSYLLAMAGKTYKGKTDSAACISADVPEGVSMARLTVWTGEFPEGPRVTYNLDVQALEPSTSIGGAQQRLRNLGHYNGPITGQMNHGTRDALLAFQCCAELKPTGLLDEATTSELSTVHP